ARIERRTVGEARLLPDSVAHRPTLRVVLDPDAVCVATDIRGIVPGAVVHDRPGEELRARIVAVPVVVYEIRCGEFPDCECQALDVALARNLVARVLDFLLPTAETKGLA